MAFNNEKYTQNTYLKLNTFLINCTNILYGYFNSPELLLDNLCSVATPWVFSQDLGFFDPTLGYGLLGFVHEDHGFCRFFKKSLGFSGLFTFHQKFKLFQWFLPK